MTQLKLFRRYLLRTWIPGRPEQSRPYVDLESARHDYEILVQYRRPDQTVQLRDQQTGGILAETKGIAIVDNERTG